MIARRARRGTALAAVLGVWAALTVPSAAAGETTTLDVLRVVDGQYVVETVTVPAREAAATEDRLEDSTGVVDAGAQVVYTVQGTPDPLWDERDPGGASHVRTAWERTTGAGQIVAVLDSAAVLDHPDLAGAAVPGTDTAGGISDPFHGTAVAGVIAARANNGIGGAGLAPDAQVMPIRVCNDSGCTSSAIAKGILWAADHGADVIDMSLGGVGYSDVIAAAIRYALDKNISLVASAGNSGSSGNPVIYPAANSGVIAVSATDPAGAPAPCAQHGWQVDIATVGQDVLVPVPGGSYGDASGTSFSGPAVAAAVALLRSSHPGISTTAVQAALQAGVESSSWDRAWGAGRLDVPAALAAADRTGIAVTATPRSGGLTVRWDAVAGAGGYAVRIDGVQKAVVGGTSADVSGLVDGTQIAVDVQPDNGQRSRPVLATVGAVPPATPSLYSAAIRGTSTSAILDLSASVSGATAPRY
ncbi:MAG: S8 family peptidase, partial [Actinomycetes bacterium]